MGERRRHVRTVRSVAQWRNRPRSRLAWLLLFIAVALLAFSVRLAAADEIPDTTLSTETGLDAAQLLPAEDDLDASQLSSAEHDLDAAQLSPSELAEAAAFDVDWSDADAADARAARREREPTRIGRVDLAITWRRTVREVAIRPVDAIASAVDPVTTARGVLWVLLTWSR